MKLQEFPVGCSENGTTLYVDVAAESKEQAEAYIAEKRPRLTIIHVGDSIGEVEVDKPKVLQLRPC